MVSRKAAAAVLGAAGPAAKRARPAGSSAPAPLRCDARRWRQCARQPQGAPAAHGAAPVVYWMRRDARVRDNWALVHAAEEARAREAPLAGAHGRRRRSGAQGLQALRSKQEQAASELFVARCARLSEGLALPVRGSYLSLYAHDVRCDTPWRCDNVRAAHIVLIVAQ